MVARVAASRGVPCADPEPSEVARVATPHNAEDKLAVFLPLFEKTIHTFKNSRTYKNNKKRYEIVGAITSREVTFGNNGWHPHLHMLVFAGHGMETNRRTVFMLKSAWMRAAKKEGLLHRAKSLKDYRNFWKYALDLRGGAKAAEYIAKFGRDEKWGQSSEMTRFHSKVGIRKGAWIDDAHFTPFQILEWANNGDKAASALFKEYAEVYHGKRMITWAIYEGSKSAAARGAGVIARNERTVVSPVTLLCRYHNPPPLEIARRFFFWWVL